MPIPPGVNVSRSISRFSKCNIFFPYFQCVYDRLYQIHYQIVPDRYHHLSRNRVDISIHEAFPEIYVEAAKETSPTCIL